jgi:hypothetical protein
LQAAFLPDTELPADLTGDELREAARALKGSILRQEVYADDGTPNAALPYSVSERSYRLTCLQHQGPNRHAVFFSHPAETIDYHYERNPADPRISHALTLAVDDYGNVLKSAAIGYQRRTPAFDEQARTLATLIESQHTNPVLQDGAYRTPLPAEVKTYELTAPKLSGAVALDFATVAAVAAAAIEIPYCGRFWLRRPCMTTWVCRGSRSIGRPVRGTALEAYGTPECGESRAQAIRQCLRRFQPNACGGVGGVFAPQSSESLAW